jgi:hypothetical protein
MGVGIATFIRVRVGEVDSSGIYMNDQLAKPSVCAGSSNDTHSTLS